MSASALPPFHLAIAVNDLEQARRFYGELLGFVQGREDTHWIDWNCYGHQLVTHLDPNMRPSQPPAGSRVDGKAVPIPHFGVVLSPAEWQLLSARVQDQVEFLIEPCTRFAGQAGEQYTMFFRDPSGNALEFKAFTDLGQLFAR